MVDVDQHHINRDRGANAYDKALKALPPDSCDWWREWIEDEADKANADGLADFIRNPLLPYYRNEESQARHQPAIRAQTLGEGLPVHRLEKLNRYETHLDRRFERTLAMLVKLKELRGND